MYWRRGGSKIHSMILDLGEAQRTVPPPTAHGAPTGSEPKGYFGSSGLRALPGLGACPILGGLERPTPPRRESPTTEFSLRLYAPHTAPSLQAPCKCKCVSKSSCPHACCKVLEKVATFPYLGRILAADNTDNAAVAAQLTKARTSFYAMSKQVLSKHTTREVKVSIFRAVVQAQLLYASETWHMTTAIRNKIDTFQQRTLRHCLGMQPTLRNGHPLYPNSEDVLTG